MLIHEVTDRRGLLKLAVAAAASGWLGRVASAQGRFGRYPFSLGVASGSPTPDGVVLWTRLMGDLPARALTVQWEVATDERFARVVRRGAQQAAPELAHSVHAEVQGLEPDRWYFYRFIADDAVSAIGRTRTLPAPDAAVARLRLAYASCQRWEHGYFSAWRHMADENLDAVLFLGDYIYEYPASSRPVRLHTGGWALSLADYRARYALYRSEPELQAMHAACPWLVTWDDHEVQNDYAAGTAGSGGPQAGDFAARRAAAYQAFYEHMPVRASALTRALAGLRTGAEMRIYSQQRFGRLANLLLLDDRQYRDPQACTSGGKSGSGLVDPAACPAWNDPARSLLGGAQEKWLEESLARGAATWTVFGQQTLFGQRGAKPGPGPWFWNDGWDGYGAARRRLTDALQRHRVGTPVMLGGDMHENWVGHVKADYADPGSAAIGLEFCGTSITSRSSTRKDQLVPLLAENPHFVFADADRRGYGVLEFTPSRLVTTLRVVDDVTRRDSRIATLAAFTAEAGRPQLERV
ncbi:alkaline phosphatase D family protein [Ramlibacter solisilvae]|uniref:Alkaline phosphatase n=1 Tax=Ramlibacter tataouinensis TaxID=94132 RepID=A0A127JP18_9BURK|nr:alkaline phosphatase D family protein [Ramlibacter tataouinensis]AMO21695.1 alkaline phosphatase [Ramlibacter tataouinensis]